jgi:hypothetical protein
MEKQSRELLDHLHTALESRVESVSRSLVAGNHRTAALLLAARTQSGLRLRFWRLWQVAAQRRRQQRLHRKHVTGTTHCNILQRTTMVQATMALRRRYWLSWKRFVVNRRGKHRLQRLSHTLEHDASRRLLARYLKSWSLWASRRHLRAIACQRMLLHANRLRGRYFTAWCRRARRGLRLKHSQRFAALLALMHQMHDVRLARNGVGAAWHGGEAPATSHASRPLSHDGGVGMSSLLASRESRLVSPQRHRDTLSRRVHSDVGPFSYAQHSHSLVISSPLSPRDVVLLRQYFRHWVAGATCRLVGRQIDAVREVQESLDHVRLDVIQVASACSADRCELQIVKVLAHKMFFGGGEMERNQTQPVGNAATGASLIRVLENLQEGKRSGLTLMDLYTALRRWVESADKHFNDMFRDFRSMQAWMTAVDEELRRVQKFVRPPFKS